MMIWESLQGSTLLGQRAELSDKYSWRQIAGQPCVGLKLHLNELRL